VGIRERRDRQKTLLRTEIVEAARELFVKHGYESVSMRRIAEKIEYSPTTIYLYFKDKSELISAICEETFARLNRKIEKVVSSAADPVSALKAGLLAYIEFGLKHPNHYRMVFLMPPQDRPKEFEESPGFQSYQTLCKAVQAGMDTGRIAPGDVLAVSQALWAAAHGVTALLVAHKHFPFVDSAKLAKMVVDSAVDGVLA
jgi:AcrR family transcriptional regulator